jgi:hypothetical protein
MQTFTIEEAAALIANRYGWHEGEQGTLSKRLLDAARDGTLTVRHPHTDLPYPPKEYCEYYEKVSVPDLNRYFESMGVQWRLDVDGETPGPLFGTEWCNLHQVLAWVYLRDRALVREGAVLREDAGFAMGLIVEAENRPGACYPSFPQAQEAVIEALQKCKLSAYGFENGGGRNTGAPVG